MILRDKSTWDFGSP